MIKANNMPDNNGLRSVSLELTPTEINILLKAISYIHDTIDPNQEETFDLQGDNFECDELNNLEAKLEQAAEDSIVGD